MARGPSTGRQRGRVACRAVRASSQRDWDRPDRELWLQALRQAIEAAGAPVVAVAHSLGCALVAHAVSRWPALVARAVRAALLVAPADVDSPAHTPPETRGFAPMPLARLPFPATVIASSDDPYVTLARARAFAAAWGADFVDAGASATSTRRRVSATGPRAGARSPR